MFGFDSLLVDARIATRGFYYLEGNALLITSARKLNVMEFQLA